MKPEFDVAILGGAFSGAATALLIKRRQPEARILIVEKATEFDRKVGESTTEVSSCFLTRVLGLTNYLGHEQLAKQGLRIWFANSPEQSFDDCVEIGARYQARLPTFQVDRAKLDAHLLELARQAGCEIWRPARVTKCDLHGAKGQSLGVNVDGEEREVRSRWVIDATGRASFLSRKLGLFSTEFRTSDQRCLGAFQRGEGLGQLRVAGTISRLRRCRPHRSELGDQSSYGSGLVVLDHSA